MDGQWIEERNWSGGRTANGVRTEIDLRLVCFVMFWNQSLFECVVVHLDDHDHDHVSSLDLCRGLCLDHDPARDLFDDLDLCPIVCLEHDRGHDVYYYAVIGPVIWTVICFVIAGDFSLLLGLEGYPDTKN